MSGIQFERFILGPNARKKADTVLGLPKQTEPSVLGGLKLFNDSERLQPNTAEVAASVMDDEAVLINFSTGVYYSMECVGALVWQLIELHYTISEIVDTVADLYGVSTEQVRQDVLKLFEELANEKIVVVDEDQTAKGKHETERPGSDRKYESPVLNVYRDMGDLLALDAPMPSMDDIPWQSGE